MKKDPIRIQANFILGFLIIQYLFGMFINLFVQFPDTKSEGTLWEFAKNQWPLVTHMIIGGLMVIGGIMFLVRTIRRKDKQLIIAASVGLAAILAAGFAGAQFVSTQVNGYSYTMAVAFIIAFASYGWGLYRSRN